MWTTENRCRYDRRRLRYESDLTDEEWAELEPEIPPAKRGGNKRTVNIREVINGIMYILSFSAQAASGTRSRRICRPRAPCTTTLTDGAMTARWIAFIMRFTSNAVSTWTERPVRRRR